ncbi:MAG: hypothetical protein QW453_04575 [Thermoprotei archaeon]
MSEHTLLLFSMTHKEANAYYEFLDATRSLQLEAQTIKTHSPGILVLRVVFEGNITTALKEAFREHIWLFRSLLKITKVDKVVDINDEKSISELSGWVNEWVKGAKYRVTVHRVKRLEEKMRIIRTITAQVTAPVDLDAYEREVIVYLVDSKLYLTLGSDNEISIQKLESHGFDNNFS